MSDVARHEFVLHTFRSYKGVDLYGNKTAHTWSYLADTTTKIIEDRLIARMSRLQSDFESLI